MEPVRFINDHQINVWPFASSNRLDAAYLDRLVTIGSLVDALNHADAMNTFGLERGDGLVDEAKRINYERDTLALASARRMMFAAMTVLPAPVGD